MKKVHPFSYVLFLLAASSVVSEQQISVTAGDYQRKAGDYAYSASYRPCSVSWEMPRDQRIWSNGTEVYLSTKPEEVPRGGGNSVFREGPFTITFLEVKETVQSGPLTGLPIYETKEIVQFQTTAAFPGGREQVKVANDSYSVLDIYSLCQSVTSSDGTKYVLGSIFKPQPFYIPSVPSFLEPGATFDLQVHGNEVEVTGPYQMERMHPNLMTLFVQFEIHPATTKRVHGWEKPHLFTFAILATCKADHACQPTAEPINPYMAGLIGNHAPTAILDAP
jgi:hypothetical protein